MSNQEIALVISAACFDLVIGFLAGYAVRAYISYLRQLLSVGAPFPHQGSDRPRARDAVGKSTEISITGGAPLFAIGTERKARGEAPRLKNSPIPFFRHSAETCRAVGGVMSDRPLYVPDIPDATIGAGNHDCRLHGLIPLRNLGAARRVKRGG
jgi:hypothetical protein